jgi:hypothetical protein
MTVFSHPSDLTTSDFSPVRPFENKSLREHHNASGKDMAEIRAPVASAEGEQRFWTGILSLVQRWENGGDSITINMTSGIVTKSD